MNECQSPKRRARKMKACPEDGISPGHGGQHRETTGVGIQKRQFEYAMMNAVLKAGLKKLQVGWMCAGQGPRALA
jgi:hypothetical protein